MVNKIFKWFYRIGGGFWLVMSGYMLREWELRGSPYPPDGTYWGVWVTFLVGIGCFILAHYGLKENE